MPVALLVLFFMMPLFAPITKVSAAEKVHDVRVLVDISGSMKKNDPENLRRPAVELLSELLPTGTRAGVWTFGEKVNMLIPLEEVDPRWKSLAKSKAGDINSVAMWTNIGLAMGKATSGWDYPDSKKDRSLILLTDGKVDVSKDAQANQNARNEILNKILPRLKQANVKIHTLALSKNADSDLLKQLALSTDGRFSIVESADQLIKGFVGAFDKSVEQDQLPITGNVFEVDGSVEEFTLLVYSVPGAAETKLVTPDGKTISHNDHPDQVSWFANTGFDLITVTDPAAGNWTIQAVFDSDNRVTIISDLKLKVEGLPNNVLQDEMLKVDISLTEEGIPIKRAEFLSLLDIEFRQEYFDKNKVWKGMLTSYNASKIKTPIDGIYEAKLRKTLLVGEHEFLVTIDGKTFKRQKKHRMTVLKGAVDVLVVEEPSYQYDGHTQYFLNLVPVKGVLDFSDTEITVSITDPSGRVSNMLAEVTPFGTWRVDVVPTQGNGKYTAVAHVSGMTQTGRYIEIKQDPVEIEYTGLPAEEDYEEIKPPELPPKVMEKPEPDSQAETAPEVSSETPTSEEKKNESVDDSEGSGKVVMISSLVIGNLALFLGIFFIYRYFVKRQNQESLDAEKRLAAASEQRQQALDQMDSEEEDGDESEGEEADSSHQSNENDEGEDEINDVVSNALDLDIGIDDDDLFDDEDDDDEPRP